MNRPDDDFNLHDHLSRAIGAEPPMASTPEHDTARGRKMLRRRRLAAVATSAAVVPALALGGWAVSSNLGSDPGSGQVLRPAGSGTSNGTPGGESSVTTSPADCVAVPVGPASDGSGGDGGAQSYPVTPGAGSSGNRASVSSSDGSDDATLCAISDVPGEICAEAPPVGNDGGSSALIEPVPNGQGSNGLLPQGSRSGTAQPDDGATMTPVPGSGSLEPADGEATLTATCVVGGDGGDISTPEIDRVQSALDRVLDPQGEHLTDSIAGGSLFNGDGSAGATPEGIYVGAGWADGDSEGSVSLSVEDASLAQPGCLDQSIAVGPDVTCEVRTLGDGSTVWVGQGSQDGAERLAVRYERPDGSVVWATADQAGEQYWTDGTGASPLAQPPATVDQLIALAQDADVHL